jgi:homoserine O-succinyltransferase/O-acetyltransferase
MSKKDKMVRVAILDMYAGEANQGMRCIRQILNEWGNNHGHKVKVDEFEVRLSHNVPDTSYDVYISSGGPGSPLESEGSEWEKVYFDWLQSIENWNSSSDNYPKKYVLFICHSYQLACRHYNIGNVCKRRSTAFGVFPIHLNEQGVDEPLFDLMPNPLYAVDSRDYQVIEANFVELVKSGATILAIEKDRPHVPLERAIMAVRFNPYFVGTQFHPEADAEGMSMYLQREDKKKTVIENHGEDKWESMIEDLNDPAKIMWTYANILPNFLNQAVGEQVFQH